MKEVIAFVRPGMADRTKQELSRQGFTAVTSVPVLGRGRQGGLVYPDSGAAVIPFLPKRKLTLFVEKADLDRAIATILRANRTGEIGDGKIFVAPLEDACRIRTGARGPEALR